MVPAKLLPPLFIPLLQWKRAFRHALYKRTVVDFSFLPPLFPSYTHSGFVEVYAVGRQHVEAWVVTDDYFHWASRGCSGTRQGTRSRWLSHRERKREGESDSSCWKRRMFFTTTLYWKTQAGVLMSAFLSERVDLMMDSWDSVAERACRCMQ